MFDPIKYVFFATILCYYPLTKFKTAKKKKKKEKCWSTAHELSATSVRNTFRAKLKKIPNQPAKKDSVVINWVFW